MSCDQQNRVHGCAICCTSDRSAALLTEACDAACIKTRSGHVSAGIEAEQPCQT